MAAEGEASEYRFLDYCLFVTFFPQFIAGPVVHHREMMPQFQRPEAMRFSHADFANGWLSAPLDLTDLYEYRDQILIAALLAVALIAPNTQEWIMGEGRGRTAVAPRWRFTPVWAGVAAACFLFTLTRLSAVSEFIYFNF